MIWWKPAVSHLPCNMVSGARLVPEMSLGRRQESLTSSSCASRRVSHEGGGQGGEWKGRDGKEVQQEKRKERPELKVVICKDGRSSARVSRPRSKGQPVRHYSAFSCVPT